MFSISPDTGDVLRVDPSIIPRIFQILYDSQGHAISNGHNGSISNSPSHSPVNRKSLSRERLLIICRRNLVVKLVKRLSIAVTTLSSWLIESLLHARVAIFHAIVCCLRLHVSSALDAIFAVTNNITTMEKILCNHVEVNPFVDGKRQLTEQCFLVYDTLSVKDLLIMCASEQEQQQWVAILKTRIKQPALVPPTPPRNPTR